jgi:small subunit ribosomal protein S6
MRYYETIYIVDPNLENTILQKTMTEIGQELEKTKAKIINHRDWGKKRLAYQVDKQKYGSFILLQFEIKELSKINDFDSWLKLNSLVLRHMTVSLDQKPDKYVDKSIVSKDSESPSDNKDNKIDA